MWNRNVVLKCQIEINCQMDISVLIASFDHFDLVFEGFPNKQSLKLL